MSYRIYKNNDGSETIVNVEKVVLVTKDPENPEQIVIYLEDCCRLFVDKSEMPAIKELLKLEHLNSGFRKLN